MIKSMTGFGSSHYDDGTYKLNIELKAVNNRYCDVSVKMPSIIRQLEGNVNQEIKKHNFRGKIDVFIKFQYLPETNDSLTVDKSLVIAYYNSLKTIKDTILAVDNSAQLEEIHLRDLASFPGAIVVEDSTIDIDKFTEILISTLDKAIQSFDAMKIAEGKHLAQELATRIDNIKMWVKEIEKVAPQRLEVYRQSLIEKVKELLDDANIDQDRITQECCMMADKLDITEELTRLQSHFQQFHKLLQQEVGVGRKLDFLIQEMNRETNTIASKANNSIIANYVVEIKGELEKIREQVQNIE